MTPSVDEAVAGSESDVCKLPCAAVAWLESRKLNSALIDTLAAWIDSVTSAAVRPPPAALARDAARLACAVAS